MPTTDYFFTSIKPAPIVVTRHRAHHSKSTAQQAATQDPVSQQTPPLVTRQNQSLSLHASKQTSASVKSSITSQTDLQNAFQSLCLCPHGRKESAEDKSAE